MDGYLAFERHVNPQLARFLRLVGRDVRFVRARGCTLEDDAGRAWDDWVAGFGSFALGHNHPELLDAARACLALDRPTLLHEVPNPYAGALAARLCAATDGRFETVHFSNGGAEAVESALKIALRATQRATVVYVDGGYHGTTLGALACMARGVYRDDFSATLPRFVEVPFGDPDALARALREQPVAAVLLEPLQVENGLRVASPAYAAELRRVCDAHGALLIFDEVQTGLGRTGTRFFYEQLGMTPDLLILAKALGAGLVPIGATLCAKDLWQRAFGTPLRCNIHDSTYGGGALACAVAERVLALLCDAALLGQVQARAVALWAQLHERLDAHPLVARIEGVGLLGGIALRTPDHPWLRWESFGMPELEGHALAGPLLVQRLARARIFAHVCAHDWNVLRVQPPLNVDAARCTRFAEEVHAALDWLAECAGIDA